jgi:two-component system chemotaxis response regulator CheY
MLSTSSVPVGLILSDWNMPKLMGIDLVKLVRADRRYARIPFVLITTESEAKKIVEAVKAGVDDYVVKPFTLDTIKAKIESAYRKKGLL